MKVTERDPLRSLRDTAVSLEDAVVAEARGRYISERLAQTIREAPARHRAVQRRRAAVWGGSAVSMLGLMLMLIVTSQLKKSPAVSSMRAPEAPGETVGPVQPDAVKGTIEELAGHVDIVHAEGTISAATRASALKPSDEVVTRTNGRGNIVLAGGARVELAENSRVRLQAASSPAPPMESRFTLLEGRVDVHVPHLDRGSSFAVLTPQAEVVVHGTVFSVEVLEPGGDLAETCVSVREGLVGVRSLGSETLLRPGMHWSSLANGSRCAVDRIPPGVPSAPARNSEAKLPDDSSETRSSFGASASRRKMRPPSARGAAPSLADANIGVEKAFGPKDAVSTAPSAPVNALAAQNRLFQAALVARQKGDERDAVRLFDELLHRYPSGALASEANEQRRRAQEHLQKVEPSSDP
jgi:hypothetical protein